jgi:23S rRNA (uracil1939-C5)-methyltransferase
VLPRELDDCAVWWHRPAPERRRQGQAPTAPPLRRLAGEEALEVRILGESFRVSPLSFFQVNTGGAETMVRQLLSLCGDRNREHVLELYCGVGLFTRFLARRAAQVTAVEVSPSACADFRANLGLPKGPGAGSRPAIRLVEAEAADALATLASERGPAPELVVADPPRAGLGREVVRALSRLRPERLVYVSCDPATLARDAAQLVREGWSVERLRLVDLFPQTAHVESVSLWHGPSRRGRIGT